MNVVNFFFFKGTHLQFLPWNHSLEANTFPIFFNFREIIVKLRRSFELFYVIFKPTVKVQLLWKAVILEKKIEDRRSLFKKKKNPFPDLAFHDGYF